MLKINALQKLWFFVKYRLQRTKIAARWRREKLLPRRSKKRKENKKSFAKFAVIFHLGDTMEFTPAMVVRGSSWEVSVAIWFILVKGMEIASSIKKEEINAKRVDSKSVWTSKWTDLVRILPSFVESYTISV